MKKNGGVETVIGRLKAALSVRHDYQLAGMLGMTKAAFSDRVKRGSLPLDKIKLLCSSHGIDYQSVISNVVAVHDHQKENGDYVHLPLYDVAASAGGGAYIEDENKKDVLIFRRWFIEEELRGKPENFSLIFVDGESMEPTLRPGEVIMVDHRDTGFQRDGVYVIRMDGTLLVKRVRNLPANDAEIISDNPSYGKFVVNKKDPPPDFAAIGRVVWVGRRM